MNFAFLFAGTTSSNPLLILLEAVMLYGWRAAGWRGLDRFLLPRIGTSWAPAEPVLQARDQHAGIL